MANPLRTLISLAMLLNLSAAIASGATALGTWVRFTGSTSTGFNARVLSMVVNGSDVYFSGSFTSVDGISASYIVRWDGHSWQQLGSGLDAEGDDIVFLNGSLYVIGKFTHAGGVPAQHVARWDGTSWSALGPGVPTYPYSAVAHQGHYYVGGGSPAWVQEWDGTSWQTVGTGDVGYAYELASYGSLLVASGGFGNFATGSTPPATTNTMPCIASWDGTQWSTFSSGVNGVVNGLFVDGTQLYVMGSFNHAGTSPILGVARWDGTTWNALGSGADNSGTAALGPQGIFFGGGFTSAGGLSASHVAFWDGTSWSTAGSGLGSITTLFFGTVTAGLLASGDFPTAGSLTGVGGLALYDLAPTVVITAPSATSSFATTAGQVSLAGTANDGGGVTQVAWSMTGASAGSGSATGTTSWSTGSIPIAIGSTTFTITVTDTVGNQTSSTIDIVRSAPTPPPPSPTPTPVYETGGTANFFKCGIGSGTAALILALSIVGFRRSHRR